MTRGLFSLDLRRKSELCFRRCIFTNIGSSLKYSCGDKGLDPDESDAGGVRGYSRSLSDEESASIDIGQNVSISFALTRSAHFTEAPFGKMSKLLAIEDE